MTSIKKNIAYNLIYRVIVMIIPLITSPYISRVLGPDNVGVFSYTSSVAYYFFLFAMLGVNNYGNREVAKSKGDKTKLSQTFWQIYYIQFFLSIILSLIYLIFVTVIDKKNILVAYIQVLYIFSAIVDINWFVFGMEEFKIATIRSTIMKGLVAICFFAFVKDASDLWIYTLIVQCGNVISLIVIWPLVKKYVYFCKPNFALIRKHLKPNFVLFLPYIASGIYIYMDKIMLGFMTNDAEIGYYQYAENIMNIPMLLTVAVGTVMLPRMSNMVKNKQNAASKSIIEKSFIQIGWINIGMFLGIAAVSRNFIPWFLGSDYARSSELLEILSVIIFLSGMCDVVRTQYMIPNSLDKQYSISIICGSIINFLLNLLLIPKLYGIGAAIASVSAYVCMFTIQCILTRKNINYLFVFRKLSPYVLIGIVMYIVVKLIEKIEFNYVLIELFLQISIGGILYIVLSFFYTKKIEMFIHRVEK